MNTNRFAIVVGALCAAVSSAASADLITSTFTGNAYFVFDNTSVTTANYTIVATGNTDNRFFVTGGGVTAYVIPNASVTLTIEGWGTAQILTPTSIADNLPYRAVGLVSADLSQLAVATDFNAVPLGWDMLSNVSTGSGVGDERNMWLSTTAGMVMLNISHSVSYTAVITPVPAPGAVALVGLAGAFGSRRRRA